jgi:hypothetical protein
LLACFAGAPSNAEEFEEAGRKFESGMRIEGTTGKGDYGSESGFEATLTIEELRDLFAAFALSDLAGRGHSAGIPILETAKDAYEYADAMIDAREVKDNE